MKYGVCSSFENVKAAAAAGCSYIECSVYGLVSLPEQERLEFADDLKRSGIRCEAMNILFPGDLALIGPDSSDAAIKEYLTGAFGYIAPFKTEIVVFGSGKARTRPEGVSDNEAFDRLTTVGRMIAAAADEHGITIALEPLNRKEANCINSLAEGAALVRSVDRPNFRLLADMYHILAENEPAGEIELYGDLIVHVHTAAFEGRACPRLQDNELLEPFFTALRKIGYNKRMSVEGNFNDMIPDLKEAFELFDKLTD